MDELHPVDLSFRLDLSFSRKVRAYLRVVGNMQQRDIARLRAEFARTADMLEAAFDAEKPADLADGTTED